MNLRKLLIEKLGGFAKAEDALPEMVNILMDDKRKADYIRQLGGFATIEDAIEAIRRKDLVEKREILTLAVRRLFNTIGADDILKPTDGRWTFAGKVMEKGMQDLVMAEAAQFENSTLFRILEKDILYQVNKKMFIGSENIDHVITAKFWLYTFDAIRTRLRSLAAGSPIYNDKKVK
jgi:hypothetical protein